MKNLIYSILVIVALVMAACSDSQQEFVVRGTVPERFNGNRIFLVPCNPKSMTYSSKEFEDSIGVDSVVIENGHFEFRGTGEYLARLTLDKKVRYGTQDLLVVTSPGGVVEVVIDSVSSASGTSQNNVLQQWKDRKTQHDAILWQKTLRRNAIKESGDTAQARQLTDSIRAFNDAFRADMLRMATDLGAGPACDLLIYRYADK